jgi:hypothetical protein
MSEAEARKRIIELCIEFGVTQPNGIHEKMLARIINGEVVTSALELEVKRMHDRDGKATIKLSYEDGDYPFNFDECNVVDFGVCDNIYVVESPEMNAMQKQLAEARATIEALAEKLGSNCLACPQGHKNKCWINNSHEDCARVAREWAEAKAKETTA